MQARQAFAYLLAILTAAGCGPAEVLRVMVYIAGVENCPVFDLIYAELLGAPKPARTLVPVPELHHGYPVEIDAIAV